MLTANWLYIGILAIAFVAGLLAVEALYGMWNATRGPEARRVAQRIRIMSAGGHASEELSLAKKRDLGKAPALEKLLLEMPRVQQLDRLIIQAGLNLSVSEFFMWTAGLFAAGLVIGWFVTKLMMFGLVVGVFAASIPTLVVLRAKQKRMHTILVQLPDALGLMSRALRAGHAFSGGLRMVADEMPDPIATEFRVTFDELNYGLSLENAMLNMTERVDIPDMKYFVISVLIQRETGGNLAAVLDKIAELIRDRLRLLGRVRVLSAQGRLEAWILSFLPFFVAGVMFTIWPDFMSILWEEKAGRVMSAIAAGMMATGIFVMWRMVKIRI